MAPSELHERPVRAVRTHMPWPADAARGASSLPLGRPTFTEVRQLLSTSALVRSGLLGAGLTILSALVALGTRWLFGVMSLAALISCAVQFAVVSIVGIGTTLVAIRWALLTGRSLRTASILGVLAGIPVMLALYAASLWVQLTFPNVELLDATEPRSFPYQLMTGLSDALPAMAVWASFVFVPTIVHTHEERQKELLRVHREAELLRLRSHLEPHFVLNTMNAIGGLVTEDPEQARELLAMLGDLFRDASQIVEHQTVAHEVAWLRRFVAIHELRFADQLLVSWDIDPATLSLTFPSLLLQPLVENALMHGALRRDRGELAIRFALEPGNVLVAEVRDNGPGLATPRRGSKGLALVEQRLALEATAGAKSPGLHLWREGETTIARVELPLTRSEQVTR